MKMKDGKSEVVDGDGRNNGGGDGAVEARPIVSDYEKHIRQHK